MKLSEILQSRADDTAALTAFMAEPATVKFISRCAHSCRLRDAFIDAIRAAIRRNESAMTDNGRMWALMRDTAGLYSPCGANDKVVFNALREKA